MKALFIGGIKSGKSKNAESYVLQHSITKPIYLATTEFFDKEMQDKVSQHQKQRGNNFDTREEPLQLSNSLQNTHSMILVECVSMWINNMLYHGHSEKEIVEEILALQATNLELIFVINDVSQSVISDNSLVRKFVEINGRVSQLLASKCTEVYHTVAGIAVKIK